VRSGFWWTSTSYAVDNGIGWILYLDIGSVLVGACANVKHRKDVEIRGTPSVGSNYT
jgi:hypothetical protein